MKLFISEQSPANKTPEPELPRILVMQAVDDKGALVMLSPALRALRQALPRAELTLMTSVDGSQIVPLLPWLDNVMIDQAVTQDSAGHRETNPREEVAFVERLRRQNFSMALIFTSVSQSPLRAAYACYLAGIPYRVGFASEMSGSLLSHVLPPPEDDIHQVDRNLSLLQAIGISGTDRRTELSIPQAVEAQTSELLSQIGVKPDLPYIVLAPGSDSVFDQYDPNHYAAVAHILAAQTEQQLLVVGSATETRTIQPVVQVVRENLYGNMYSLVEKTTLAQLAAIIRRASLIISGKSVSMQFAEAFGCPMVILHPERDMANQWMPRNASARLLSRPADCPIGINYLDLRPEEVAIAALEMLAEQTSPQADYQGIFGYKIVSETNESSSAR